VRDLLYSHMCGAGRGARKKYRAGVGRWRKRVFRRPTLILALVSLVPIFAIVLDKAGRGPMMFGIVTGAVMAGYLTLRESPPQYIENWNTGAEGELRTARALAPLRRAGYVLLHDLPDRQRGSGTAGNLDHVVICTAGVFLLDSKYLGGEASIHGDTVHVQRRDDDDESYDRTRLARGMRGCALRLQRDIASRTGVRFVQAVVVFWNPFPQGVVAGEKVTFLHGERLVAWLQQQPEQMPADAVREVARAIADARPPEHRSWLHAAASTVLGRLRRRTPARGIVDA